MRRYIAVVSASEEKKNASRQAVLERERDFFMTNQLLQGLRADRWGTPTLKNLIIRFQVRCVPSRRGKEGRERRAPPSTS